MSNFDIKELTVADLYQHQEGLEARAVALKADVAEFVGELARRYDSTIEEGRKRIGKASGSLTEVLSGGYRLKHEAKLNVSWDTDKLMAWAGTVPWETVTHNCRIKFEVKEANYKTLDPSSDLKKTFADARTEKSGKPSYELLAPSQK